MNCFYCDTEIFKKPPTPLLGSVSIIDKLLPRPRKLMDRFLLATKDHTVPRRRTKGQRNDEVVLCCLPCNQEKNLLTREEFRVVQAFRYGYISGVEFKFPGEVNGQ